MPAPNAQQQIQEIPLEIVGGNSFGRYAKISDARTFNMIVSDDWLVPYAGYKRVVIVGEGTEGRGLYATSRAEIMLAVIGQEVVTINADLTFNIVGALDTSEGDVFIAENNGNQLCITDGVKVYIYNYVTTDFWTSVQSGGSAPALTFNFPFASPGYVSFQNGRFIIANLGTQQWILSGYNDGTSWPADDISGAAQIGVIQTKPGSIQAAVPVPGGSNNLLILGSNVAEPWQDLGLALFPYQRNSTSNVDFGCLNASSIGELDNQIVWLAVNEQSGPIIMVYYGGQTKAISTDGIDFKLADLTNPSNCSAFLFRQDGHLIYQFTFPDDNLSYAYDFNTSLFFTVTDDNLNYHIARQVVFFNNDYYFVSLKGGHVYRFGTQYTDAEYAADNIKELPRIRICPPLRLPTQRYFIGKSLGFTVENGQPNEITTTTTHPGSDGDSLATENLFNITTEDGVLIGTEMNEVPAVTYETRSEAIDLSISMDGGATFGSSERREMNKVGVRKSRLIWQRLGIANDAVYQIRFSGYGRWLATDGIVEIYQ